MRVIICLILLILLPSCAAKRNTPVFQPDNDTEVEIRLKNNTVHIKLPGSYKVLNLTGGHHEIEKQYTYANSSKIYVSDFTISDLNYDNVRGLGDSITKKRFESIEYNAILGKEQGIKYSPETITLEGKTTKGLFWKDIRIGYLCVGYVNVSKRDKDEFDAILASFKSH